MIKIIIYFFIFSIIYNILKSFKVSFFKSNKYKKNNFLKENYKKNKSSYDVLDAEYEDIN